MQNVVSIPAVAAVCLLAAQAVLLLVRIPSCVRRAVPLLLVTFLILLSVHALLPQGSVLHDLIVAALLWAAGSFLIRATNRKMLGTWTGANIAFICTLLLCRALGYEGSISYAALLSFGITLLAAVPLGILLQVWRAKHSLSSLFTFFAGSLWLALAGIQVITSDGITTHGPFVAAPELLLSLCTGWLVFQEGYPNRAAWRGSLSGLTRKEGMTQSLYALADQERITSSGFLALGAAHEFKNILSLVRLAAHHGLTRKDSGEKDECLRLIVEHTNTARDSAIEVLEHISTNGGEEGCTLDAARDLIGPIRRAGAGLRGEGIVIETDFGAGVAFRARRFDVEQIVLNLIHNAAESYRRRPSEETRTINVLAREGDECAVIEVRDSAGGVQESVRHKLFTLSDSGTGGGGLGLYLSRNLALANGGCLDYQPMDGGSAFILSLPGVFAPDAFTPREPRT